MLNHGKCRVAASARSKAVGIDRENPMGFGRKGERVANTPFLVLPPSLGGRTIGDQVSLADSENSQISQI